MPTCLHPTLSTFQPPNKGARSTRRWFELFPNEIIYYSKKEQQRGNISYEKEFIYAQRNIELII